MASPGPVEAEEAAGHLDIVAFSPQLSGDSDKDDCDSVPPSPEIGMAREGDSAVQDLQLEEDDEDDAVDANLPTPPATLEQNGDNEGHAEGLPGRQSSQQPAPANAQRADSEPTDPQLTHEDATFPPMRRSVRVKSTLVYDQKYHPMDDVIRPSQAAKRRLIHGVKPVLHLYTEVEASESDSESMVNGTDDEEDSQPPTRGRKRKRSKSQTPEPTRRSSRRKTEPKVSYNVKIHPQDSDLKRAYAYDGSNNSPSPSKQTSYRTATLRRRENSLDDLQETCQSLLVVDSDDPNSQPTLNPSLHLLAKGIPEPTLKQVVKLGDVYPDLHPDVAYLTGYEDPWPGVKGSPFCIYTERIEDQLNAEAEAASPFHYDDDDKENDVINPELAPIPNPLDGVSMIPASSYRRPPGLQSIPSHGSIASNALYLHSQFEALPYGLGWSDGDDIDSGDSRDCPFSDYMRILASGEDLPRTYTPTEAPSHDNDASVGSSPIRHLSGHDLRR